MMVHFQPYFSLPVPFPAFSEVSAGNGPRPSFAPTTQWAIISCQGGFSIASLVTPIYNTFPESLAKTGQNRCAIDMQLVLV